MTAISVPVAKRTIAGFGVSGGAGICSELKV